MYFIVFEFFVCSFVLLTIPFLCCRKKPIPMLPSTLRLMKDNSERPNRAVNYEVDRKMSPSMEDRTQTMESSAPAKKSSPNVNVKSKNEVPDKSVVLPGVSVMQAEGSVRTALKNIPQHCLFTVDRDAFLKMLKECSDRHPLESDSQRSTPQKDKVVHINEMAIAVYEIKHEPTIDTETTQSSHRSAPK